MVAAPDLIPEPALQRWTPGVASATLSLRAGDPCGDVAAWFHWPAVRGPLGDQSAARGPQGDRPGCLLAIIDGLGHGPEAARAAEAARVVLAAAAVCLADPARGAPEAPAPTLPALLQALDVALAGLRGAAIGLMQVQGDRLWHTGVGNTRAMRWRDQRLSRLASHNGIVGGGLPGPLQVEQLDLQADDWLLLFTDGLDERLQLPLLLPEWRRDPALLCAHLLRQHRLGRDDAGVLVMQVGAA